MNCPLYFMLRFVFSKIGTIYASLVRFYFENKERAEPTCLAKVCVFVIVDREPSDAVEKVVENNGVSDNPKDDESKLS